MIRKFNNLPLRDISEACHPNKITIDEFISWMELSVSQFKNVWIKHSTGDKERYIEDYMEIFLAYNELETD